MSVDICMIPFNVVTQMIRQMKLIVNTFMNRKPSNREMQSLEVASKTRLGDEEDGG